MIFRETIEKRETEEIESIRSLAISKAKEVAALLKRKYGAKRVILFGSLCYKTYLHKGSDIDLLVEGINTANILRAGYEAWMIAKPFDIELIPIEVAKGSIVKIALEEGVEL